MTATDDHDSIAGWLAEWGKCIASLDFARARTLFDSGVVGFGTFSDLLVGIDDLEARQWRAVWPAISGFRFDLDGLWTEVSPDRRLGHLAAGWTSTGAHEDGTSFPRPGRCTVTLRRADPASPWLGTHTHFSLNSGTPAVSHRPTPKRNPEPIQRDWERGGAINSARKPRHAERRAVNRRSSIGGGGERGIRTLDGG